MFVKCWLSSKDSKLLACPKDSHRVHCHCNTLSHFLCKGKRGHSQKPHCVDIESSLNTPSLFPLTVKGQLYMVMMVRRCFRESNNLTDLGWKQGLSEGNIAVLLPHEGFPVTISGMCLGDLYTVFFKVLVLLCFCIMSLFNANVYRNMYLVPLP